MYTFGKEQLNGIGTRVIQEAKFALIGPTSAIGDSLGCHHHSSVTTISLTLHNQSQMLPGFGLCSTSGLSLGTISSVGKIFRTGYKAGLEGVSQFMATGQLDNHEAVTILV